MVNSSLNLDFSEEIHIHYYCNNYSRSVDIDECVCYNVNNKTNKEELYNGIWRKTQNLLIIKRGEIK